MRQFGKSRVRRGHDLQADGIVGEDVVAQTEDQHRSQVRSRRHAFRMGRYREPANQNSPGFSSPTGERRRLSPRSRPTLYRSMPPRRPPQFISRNK